MGIFSCFGKPHASAAPTSGQRPTNAPPQSSKLADQHAGAGLTDTSKLSRLNCSPATPAQRPLASQPEAQAVQPGRDPLAQQPSCRYRRLRDLNTGSSGFVQLAEDCTTQQRVAVKFLDRGTKVIKDADREICNLRLCCMHPYIIRFREAFLLDSHLAIVLDYASLGDLADFIDAQRARSKQARGLPEEQARRFFQQLMLAVDFCHKKGIVNRDLKLENILLTPSTDKGMEGQPMVKLCDFGFSKDEAVDSICKTACGTPEYVAPEVLLYNQYSGKAADMWSAGVILYVMLTGSYPFREPADERLPAPMKLKAMFPRIVRGQFARPPWMSTSLCDLLGGLLRTEPKQRFSVSDVLAHPWFCEGLPLGAAGLNANLLQISDMLLTSFTAQTEDQILTLVQAAMHKPAVRRMSKQHARPSDVRPSLDAQISNKQKQKHQPSADAGSGMGTWSGDVARPGAHAAAQPGTLGPRAHVLPDEGVQRWTLSAAHCSDEAMQAMLPSQRYRPVAPSLLASSTSSQYSHMASTINPMSSSGLSSTATSMTGLMTTGLTATVMGVLEESPGSSYDDLIADAGNASPADEPHAADAPVNPFAQTAVTSSWQKQNSDAAQHSGSGALPGLPPSPFSSAEPQLRPSKSKDRSGAKAAHPRSSAPRATIAAQPALRSADRCAGSSQSPAQATREAACQNDAASANPRSGEATLAPRPQHAKHRKAAAQMLCPAPQKPMAATTPASKPMVSPFALVMPAGKEQGIAVELPANIPCSPSALACRTPDLPDARRAARAASATTSLESALSLAHAQSNFRASSSDADFGNVLKDMPLAGRHRQVAFA